MSSFKTGSSNKKLQPGVVLLGENGLPIDTIATIAGSYQIIKNSPTTLSFSSGVVTVSASVDLSPARSHKSRYTGRLILQTTDNSLYFIDKPSIDNAAHTFSIYNDEGSTSVPATIDLSVGWVIAEAEIVNRLATSSAAKIDTIEFRDMQFQLELDGDPVSIVDEDGDKLNINPDGSVNTRENEAATDPTILNPIILLAGVQQLITLPAGIKRITVKAREGTTQLKIRYSPAAPYHSIGMGAVYREENLYRKNNLAMYVESNKPNQVIEIVYWT